VSGHREPRTASGSDSPKKTKQSVIARSESSSDVAISDYSETLIQAQIAASLGDSVLAMTKVIPAEEETALSNERMLN
jgi:hypothetical protein